MWLTRRNGDPVRIEPHITANPKGKGKKKEDDEAAVEGVIYRVSVPRNLDARDEGLIKGIGRESDRCSG